MVARHLITTADERTWTKEKPVLFLGEWCKRFSRKKYWECFESETVSYHWDDRKKLQKDYHYLQNIHEQVLSELAEQLNQIHGVNHSLRYWRILIGPWLGLFVQMLFDRWKMLKKAFEEYNIDSCTVLFREDSEIIPNDLEHFNSLFINDDWNEVIYGQLLQEYFHTKVDIRFIKVSMKEKESNDKNFLISKLKIKKFIHSTISIFNRITVSQNEYFFISSSLPLIENFKLQMRLGQIPKLWSAIKAPSIKLDSNKRQLLCNSSIGTDDFISIVYKMLSKHIPTLYLEGYNVLCELILKLPWPNNPKGIFTNNSYWSDDVFKAWAAEKTEYDTPFVIGQHGGHFGMTPWSFNEEHQIEIADKWLSWGWSDDNKKNIIPVANLKDIDRKVTYNPNGYALMVEMAVPRYSYHLYAMPVAGQWLSYFKDQCHFISKFPDRIQSKISIRLYPGNFGWDERDRWLSLFPKIHLDSNKKPIHKIISKCRLYISTYNATTYLESLSWNVPSIIFWSPECWELKKEVKPYFELLESVGIFHQTPESAAKQVIKVWDDVDAWWKRKDVQSARKQFCLQFSKKIDKPVDELESIISCVKDK